MEFLDGVGTDEGSDEEGLVIETDVLLAVEACEEEVDDDEENEGCAF